MHSDLGEAYDPEAFRRLAHAAVDQLADHLARTRSGAVPVTAWRPPAAAVDAWATDFPGGAEPGALLARFLDEAMQLHHPRYIGHQVTAPVPLSAVFELAGALLNNGMAIYEMGPSAVAMERAIIAFFSRALGLGAASDGVLTSGGSAGNLTALLAMRQSKAGGDAWRAGGGGDLAVLACAEAHYSVRRATQMMGWGEGGVALVPADDRYRMRADALEARADDAGRAGRKVIGVVASIGSTSTGAVDPIEAIADVCARRGWWLHVDGAHGASCALATRHRRVCAGVDRADSVVWDAHKMMLVPSLVTAVLFRDGAHSHAAFAQQAAYLFASPAERADPEWFDLGTRTLECTKPTMSLPLYAALATYGARAFGAYVDACIDRAQRFAAHLREEGDFLVPVEPELNIVCFRHVPRGFAGDAAALDALQDEVRVRLLESGTFYIVKTRLRTGVHLRVTIINPATRDGDLIELARAIRRTAAALA